MKKTASESAAPAEPLERARLQADVAKQRVRIAKEELKRARKRLKEAKREAKRARKHAAAARKAFKRARRARQNGASPAPAGVKAKAGGRNKRRRTARAARRTAVRHSGRQSAKVVRRARKIPPRVARGAGSRPAGRAAPRRAPRTVRRPRAAAPADNTLAAPAADTSIVQGKVDELLEKARLAMHERRFTEPAGDNALLYYRSAVAADGHNAEAHDGLARVAGVLAARFDEALNGGRFDEAALNLANFKAATAADPRVGAFELRLYSAQIGKALADGNLDRAAALVHQAQQSSGIAAEQIARWRADVTRRQEDAKVQRLAGLVDDRIHDGRLIEADDSAKGYLQQLIALAPANASTQRATHELSAVYLHKAREAALARNSAEQERWLAEARAIGTKPADIATFERELAGARQKATQAESDRQVQLARERLRDGRLSDPAQDSAAYYLTQVQATDPGSTSLAEASRELAQALLARARASIGAGKPADADLVLARRFGADPQDVLAVQQLQSQPKDAASDTAALASLKRVRATPPEYPQAALSQRITGSVTLEYTVDAHGEPRDVHVIEASPPGVFDQAAITAVKHWRYAPPLVNGAAVEVPVRTRVRFELPK